jgi:hypothetical protein
MAINIDEFSNELKYRHLKTISYNDIIPFIFEYLKKRTTTILLFWAFCIVFLLQAVYIRFSIAGNYELLQIMMQSLLGFVVFPVILIPVHEFLHIAPYFITGARNIRIGMDLKQYMFYVTAHRYVASPAQFKLVALTPFILINSILVMLILIIPGLWQWSFSICLFAHTTMCTGDFALLNFYSINRDKKIYTWDDADNKEAYFYEKTG